MASAMTIAWATRALASARRPAPSARATAEPADEVGLEDVERDLGHEHEDVGRRQGEERRGDGRLEEPAGRRVHVTFYFIVTSISVKRRLYSGRAQALRPGVPGGEVARRRRRPLDPPARARPAPRPAALPGLTVEPQGDRAESFVRPAEA